MPAQTSKLFRIILAGSFVLFQSRAYALPQGESVVSGTASFDRSVDQQLHVSQTSDKLITNYNSFSIAQPELVQFHQPSSSSVALNRVVGGDPSSIMGSMRANGQVFLINPNGIIFGSTAKIDVNGLVASTLDITNADFLSGQYNFQGHNGSVVNQGAISAPGGYVALLGAKVLNEGSIEAELGSVALASGDAITLSLDPQGIVNVAAGQAASFTSAQDAAVTNSGTIKANGGKVLITAKSLNSVFDHAINNSGVIEAQTITEHNGKIVLTGDDDIEVGGTIRGGDVKVVSTDADVIHVSGGRVRTSGGSFQGQAGHDYKLQNNVIIDAQTGVVDIKAGRNIELGLSGQADSVTGAYIRSMSNVFLTADTGYIHQGSGKVYAEQLMLNSNRGISGIGPNGGLYTRAVNLSVMNRSTGDVLIDNGGSSTIADLTSETGLNSGVHGYAGITNQALGGSTDVYVSPLVLDYRVDGNVEDWGVDLFGPDGHLIGYLDRVHPYGGNDIDMVTEDNDDITFANTFVGPGYSSHNNYDAEAVYVDNDSKFVYFSVITGTPKDAGYIPGDVGIDVDGNGKFEYAVKISDGHLYRVNEDSGWEQPQIFTASGPWQVISGQDLGKVDFVYSPDQNSHYVLEGKIALNSLGLDASTSSVNVHWTMQCGNDALTLSGDYNPVKVANLLVDAPITGRGDIGLSASGDVRQTSRGKVTIQDAGQSDEMILVDAWSTSHTPSEWSNKDIFDVSWSICPECRTVPIFTVNAQGQYIMDAGSSVKTNGGNAAVTANGSVFLSLIDAGLGSVSVTSNHGSILDNDLGTAPNDYDVRANHIELSAPEGTIGQPGPEQEIDLGDSGLAFSYLLSQSPWSSVDNIQDPYTAMLDENGDWIYSASMHFPEDSANWWFHIKGYDPLVASISATTHLGPFLIDTTAPVITATYDPANAHGWYNHDVTVGFSATDNLSGFSPDGSLFKDMGSQTSSGEGSGLIITSAGIMDRAGNIAVPASVTLNIDKTAPVITASRDIPANVHGWNNTDVTVSYSVSDALSGVDSTLSQTADDVFNTDGANQIANGIVYDLAGNSASASISGINIDKTPPTITAVRDVEPNQYGWNNTDVHVTYTVTDALSGVDPNASQAGDNAVMLGSTLVGSHTFDQEGFGLLNQGLAYDLAGNSAIALVNNVNIDKTAPVILGAMALPNQYGWYNHDVAVDFQASDNLSGFAPNGALGVDLGSQTISGEGVGLSVSSGVVSDLAGNVAQAITASANIDKTPPVITAARATGSEANAHGWNNTDVTVQYSVSDGLSGVLSGAPSDYADDVVSSEGANQSVSGVVYDLAGNSAIASISGINIDKTVPIITASRDIPANVHGWNNTDVTVSYLVSDALSGVDSSLSQTADDVFNTDGANQTANGIVYDLAGNSASASIIGINIDKTAPLITASRDIPANVHGWNNTDVTVSYLVSDALSGVDSSLSQTADDVFSSEGTGFVANGVVYDLAGNSANASISGINIDKTAPVITAGTPSGTQLPDGSYTSNVTVPFSATDNLSGFEPNGALGTNLADKTTSGSGDGLTVTSDGIYDLAGNFAPGIPAGPFRVVLPQPQPTNDSLGGIQQNLRVYYEILSPSQFRSFEPIKPIGLFGYHPLTETDRSAFDALDMSPDAYQFIDDLLKKKANEVAL